MNDKKIIDGIKKCLCDDHLKDHLLIDASKICLLTNLCQDAVFDDLDWLEFHTLLEEHFQIEIPDDEIDKWKKVENVAQTVWLAIIKKENNGSEKKYPPLKSRFEIITRDVDTLADFLFHITEDLPWFAREERLERIKRFLQETP